MLAHLDPMYWITWFPGALVATLALLAGAWKWIEKVVEAKRTLREVRLALPKIQAEFSPNGGGSMKDRVEELHRKVDEQGEVMVDHMANDRTAFAKQDRFNTKIEGALERIEDHLTG